MLLYYRIVVMLLYACTSVGSVTVILRPAATEVGLLKKIPENLLPKKYFLNKNQGLQIWVFLGKLSEKYEFF